MQALLYFDLSTKRTSETPGGGAWTPPATTQGEDITLGYRLTQTFNGSAAEVQRTYRNLKAGLGRVDLRPTSGTTRLKVGTSTSVVGTNVTVPLASGCTAEQMASALNALTLLTGDGVSCLVQLVSGTYRVTFSDGAQRTIAPNDNALFPLSFVFVTGYSFDGKWVHEIRFTQAPLCYTSDSARVLPKEPVIARVQAGGTTDGYAANEIQSIQFTPGFTGALAFHRDGRTTLTTFDSSTQGADALQAALNTIADSGGNFVVTSKLAGLLHIEFQGTMGGASQSLLTFTVTTFRPGDITFTLPTKTAELDDALKASTATDGSLKLLLEVSAEFQDPADDTVWHPHTLLRSLVTILPALNRDELGVLTPLNWTHPPQPVSYAERGVDQITVGSLAVPFVRGNGSSKVFDLTHNLDARTLRVDVRENKDNGKMLAANEDFTVVFTDNNTCRVTTTATDAYGVDGLIITVILCGSRAVYNEHTHTTDEVFRSGTSLSDILDGLTGRVSTLESVVGITGGGSTSQQAVPSLFAQWKLPKWFELYPLRAPFKDSTGAVISAPNSLAEIDVTKLPRSRGLLGAVHDASAESLTVPLPAPSNTFIGRVFVNSSGSTVTLPGALGHKPVALLDGEYAACDGRLWYRVAKLDADSSLKSWFPTDFDRTLFEIAVNDKQLALNRTLSLLMGLEVAVLRSLNDKPETATRAQWTLVIEHGAFTTETSPSTTAPNLKAVTWNATPILRQRIMLEPLSSVHFFGITIARKLVSAVDTITATQTVYGAQSGGGSAPASANFALRARLVEFDTEDSVSDPHGFAAILGLDKIIGDNTEGIGAITIKSSS